MKKRILFLLVAVLTMALSTGWAQYDYWTTVGSAGTVDESDTGIVSLGSPNSAIVCLRDTSTGTLNIRYNVTAVNGLFGGGARLTVRFSDDGANAQVIVRLKRCDIDNGNITTMLTFDSNLYAASDHFQVQDIYDCGLSFDFSRYAYYMDVQLIKSAGGLPMLTCIQLSWVLC